MPLPRPAPNEDALYAQSDEAKLAREMFMNASVPPTPEQVAEMRRLAELSDEGLSPSQFGNLEPLH